jgi:tRNA C32,U32 (ribose-2'-O)-methylase TrmJ
MALRACLNFGPAELHLIAPKRPSLLVHPDFLQMSHGAGEARRAIVVHDSLQSALRDTHRVVGFTARPRDLRDRRDWRKAVPEMVPVGNSPDERLALVFGTEETGLDRREVDQCGELVHIRTGSTHTSLNLAMAVTVVLSDLFAEEGHRERERGSKRLDQEGRHFLAGRMKEVFAEGIMQTPEAAKLVTQMIERVMLRAPLQNRDAKAWHLILKTLGSEMTPTDLGIVTHEKGQRRRELKARLNLPDEEDPRS